MVKFVLVIKAELIGLPEGGEGTHLMLSEVCYFLESRLHVAVESRNLVTTFVIGAAVLQTYRYDVLQVLRLFIQLQSGDFVFDARLRLLSTLLLPLHLDLTKHLRLEALALATLPLTHPLHVSHIRSI